MKRVLNKILGLVNFFRQIYWKTFKPVTFGVRVILIRDNKLILVKHRYDKFWYLPGGGIKSGETEKSAARRETLEEVGISITSFNNKILGRYQNNQEGKIDTIVIFVSEKWKKIKYKQNIEIQDINFFSLQDLPENTSPATRRRIHEFLSRPPKVYFKKW